MIESLISSPSMRMLEQTLNFTEQRHEVLLENIANADTPGYVQRDLSVKDFEKSLSDAVRIKRESNNGFYEPRSTDTVTFEPGTSHLQTHSSENPNSVAFHDRGIRSMEYQMSELADNAMAHNLVAQMLRGKYDSLSRAISMRV